MRRAPHIALSPSLTADGTDDNKIKLESAPKDYKLVIPAPPATVDALYIYTGGHAGARVGRSVSSLEKVGLLSRARGLRNCTRPAQPATGGLKKR